MSQSLGQQFFDLLLEASVIFDPPLAFFGDWFADRFGGALALDEPRPAVVEAVKFGSFAFAGAMGLATGAPGGGDASRQQRDRNLEQNNFIQLRLHCPNVYIH